MINDHHRKLLQRLREGASRLEGFGGDYDACLESITKLPLDELGTNREELQQIRVSCCKAYARKILFRLREGTLSANGFAVYLQGMLQRDGVSLEDAGTTEQEMKGFESK